MATLKFNLDEKYGKFKILNATNGGPWHKRHVTDQLKSNLKNYKAARIPYSRNHDSNMCTVYGGPYAHDITAIFPNFDADPENPDSYDFACTDESILVTLDAGTKTFFRLGQTGELINPCVKRFDQVVIVGIRNKSVTLIDNVLAGKIGHKKSRICLLLLKRNDLVKIFIC